MGDAQRKAKAGIEFLIIAFTGRDSVILRRRMSENIGQKKIERLAERFLEYAKKLAFLMSLKQIN